MAIATRYLPLWTGRPHKSMGDWTIDCVTAMDDEQQLLALEFPLELEHDDEVVLLGERGDWWVHRLRPEGHAKRGEGVRGFPVTTLD